MPERKWGRQASSQRRARYQFGKTYERRQLVAERFASSFGKGEFTVIVEEANRQRHWSDSSAASDSMKPLKFLNH